MNLFTPDNILKNNDSILRDTEFWNIYDFAIMTYGNFKTRFRDLYACSFIKEGLTPTFVLSNINGSYKKYKDNIFVNHKQTLLVSGENYGSGIPFFELSSEEQIEIINNIQSEQPVYSLFRDGPYILTNLVGQGVWVILNLPNTDSTDTVSLTENIIDNLFDNEFSDNLFVKNHTVVKQVSAKPPRSLKSTRDYNLSKQYQNWILSSSPLSRNWEVNRSKFDMIRCVDIRDINYDMSAQAHFLPLLSTAIDNPIREPETISRSLSNDLKTKEQYNLLLTNIKNKFLTQLLGPDQPVPSSLNDIIVVPNILSTFDMEFIKSEDGTNNYYEGLAGSMGYVSGYPVEKLRLFGKFHNIKNLKSIIYGSKYTVDKIYIDYGFSFKEFNRDEISRNIGEETTKFVLSIEKLLTSWSRKTAFLVEIPICFNQWVSSTDSYSLITTDEDDIGIFPSKFSKKMFFNNQKLALFYDRVYEFMNISGDLT